MKVLITGGTGTVGRRLTALLLENEHEVVLLSRSKSEDPKVFQWDIDNNYIEEGAFDGVEALVHLAGAGVADQRWTKKRKAEIMDSRVKSTQLLVDKIESKGSDVKAVVTASAVGYYGWDTKDAICIEGSNHGEGFLTEVVKDWEKETSAFRDLKLPTAQLRIGIVLDKDGGALQKMAQPTQLGLGAPLGSGNQWMSWIHVEDLCRMIIHSFTKKLDGVYNAVSPTPVTNAHLSKELAQQLNKPFFMPNVPQFVLKLMLGEMAGMVLGGNRVSAEKIIESGFSFKFTQISDALADIYGD